MGPAETLTSLSLDLPAHRSGKVRESWRFGPGRRLLVTTDRLSALDRVVGEVEHKGQVLNQLAAWWFDQTSDIVANHVIEVPDPNALIAVDATPLPVEIIMRGRLTGSTSTSLLPRYQAGERLLYGHRLPDGLADHGPLETPLLTPTTKAQEGGHDEPVTAAEIVERGLVDAETWGRIETIAAALFTRGVEVAARGGFILADTKYEFGWGPDGELLLIDEIHTPDSSRYWKADSLTARLSAGLGPENYDKEPVRLALRSVGYTGDGPAPNLDDEVWIETSRRYVELYEAITGERFEPGSRPIDQRIMSMSARLNSENP